MLQVQAVTVISGNGHLNEDGTVSSFGYGIRCNAPRLRVLAAYIGLSSDGSSKVANMVHVSNFGSHVLDHYLHSF